MMTRENDLPTASYALLASGANFSCEVLAALQQQRFLPELLILPEFPPAKTPSSVPGNIQPANPQRRLLQQAQGIEVAYAPQSQQAECARLINLHKIDFLLVACWPYLIDNRLIESSRKGALNMHPSLLPAFRGPDPIRHQLMDPGSCYGVSLHLLSQQFDQGDIVAQAKLENLHEPPDRLYLEQRCAILGVELFMHSINQHQQGWIRVPQAV